MQANWLFTGLLPDVDALLLLVYLGFPAFILLWLAREIEHAAERSLDSLSAEAPRLTKWYSAHPQRWNRIHNVANELPVFLISQWILFVWGFIPAVVAFVTMLLILGAKGEFPYGRTGDEVNV